MRTQTSLSTARIDLEGWHIFNSTTTSPAAGLKSTKHRRQRVEEQPAVRIVRGSLACVSQIGSEPAHPPSYD